MSISSPYTNRIFKLPFWCIVAALSLAVIFLLLMYQLLFHTQTRLEQALLSSQRVEISVNTIENPATTSESQHYKTASHSVNLGQASYSAVIKGNSAKANIVVIIKGLGLHAAYTKLALSLPNSVTLGFSPYAPKLDDWISQATSAGYDFLIHLPMQSDNAYINDMGPFGLSSFSDDNKNTARLISLLSQLPQNPVALYSEKNENFTDSNQALEKLITDLHRNDLSLVYGKSDKKDMALSVAERTGLPLYVTDIVIDEIPSKQHIIENLAIVKEKARSFGTVIVYAHPYPLTIRLIEEWIQGLNPVDYSVVSLSNLKAENDSKNK